MAKTFALPAWEPDVAQLGTGVSGTMSGVIPRADGYGPFKSLVDFTQSLPSRCRGYFFARRSDGSIAIFAGTEDRLYRLDSGTFQWVDVSKSGAAYSTLVTNSNWQFRQFNDLVIAAQVNTVPQKFTLASSSAFEDLGGSPPQAAFIAIVNRFVVLTGLLSASRRIQWSDLDAPETWTAGTGLADFQDLPDGGTVKAVAGGDMYGAVFQDESIRTITYSPGSATTFQITRLSTQDTLYAQYSPVEINGRIYFISAQGFKVIEPGGVPRAIGKERVDRTFFADVDTSNLQLIIGCADPQATRIYWSYKSGQGQAELFDKVMCFDPAISDKGRWTVLPIVGEYLASLARPGLTLEQLDAIAPTPLNVVGTSSGTAGRVRLELNALSNSDFNIVGQNFIRVYEVGGTTEANGTWAFNVIDSTHIDLIGTTYANAWTSGGHIGGSLDALPFSLDSISTASLAALSAFNSDHKAGFFTGPNLEAIMETSEQDLEGSLVFISGVTPLTDSPDMLCSIGGRMRPQGTVSYSAESAVNADDGMCPQLIETRYARVRARVPAGSVWAYCRAVQPEAVLAGDH